MGNPMMVIMVLTFGLVVLFPKMLGLDKEQMKELMEQQKQQGIENDPTKAFQKLFGMESKNDDDDQILLDKSQRAKKNQKVFD